MLTARIETESRQVPVKAEKDIDGTIRNLQKAVSSLRPEDGRCRFIICEDDEMVCSWSYSPAFRETGEVEVKKMEKSGYVVNLKFFVLLNGLGLCRTNFYRDDEGGVVDFDDVKAAHAFMKERGYSRSEYRVVYEYCVSNISGNSVYGFGLGFSEEEARENLNESLSNHALKLLENQMVEEVEDD